MSQFWTNSHEIHAVGAGPPMGKSYCFWKQSAPWNQLVKGKMCLQNQFFGFHSVGAEFLKRKFKNSIRYTFPIEKVMFIHSWCKMTPCRSHRSNGWRGRPSFYVPKDPYSEALPVPEIFISFLNFFELKNPLSKNSLLLKLHDAWIALFLIIIAVNLIRIALTLRNFFYFLSHSNNRTSQNFALCWRCASLNMFLPSQGRTKTT